MDSLSTEVTAAPAEALITVGALAGSSIAPFAASLGIAVLRADEGYSVLSMPFRPSLANRRGVVHGGAIATLMDSSMAVATRSTEIGLELSGTVDLNIHFLAPGKGDLTACSEVKRSGKSLAFCQCEVRDGENTLVALAMGSFMLRRPRAA